jgi:hypothetical protein
MFYGLVVPPKKETDFKAPASAIIHLSSVILNSKSAVVTRVFLEKGNQRFLIALLDSEKQFQVPIDLYLSSNDKVTFYSDNAEVHVVGYQEENDLSLITEDLRQMSNCKKKSLNESSMTKGQSATEQKKSGEKPPANEKSLKDNWQQVFGRSLELQKPKKTEKLQLVSPLLVQKQAQLFQSKSPVRHDTKPLPVVQQTQHLIIEDTNSGSSDNENQKSIDFNGKQNSKNPNALQKVKKINPSKKSIKKSYKQNFELIDIDDLEEEKSDGFAQRIKDFEEIDNSENDEEWTSLQKRAKLSVKSKKSVTKQMAQKSVQKSTKKGDNSLKLPEPKASTVAISVPKVKEAKPKASRKYAQRKAK